MPRRSGQYTACPQNGNLFAFDRLDIRLECLVNIAARPRMTDLVSVQMGQRIEHRYLPVIKDVIVRQRHTVNSGITEPAERCRFGTESKGLLRRFSPYRDRSFQIGKSNICLLQSRCNFGKRKVDSVSGNLFAHETVQQNIAGKSERNVVSSLRL
ncbi:hypothetical protein D3C81_1321740 [compost metagenome]